MSCSKILSGDLPELTYEIIKYFRNDYSTLYSCILVNRLWCRLAIPLLWENPFSIHIKNYNFIKIYIHNLNDDFKIKLNECKIINNNSLHSNTLFNYPSFLKYLNINNFVHSVDKCYGNQLYSESIKFKKLICMSLFGKFIENEVNLHTLEIDYYTTAIVNDIINDIVNDIVEFILKNPNFILNIRNLKLYITIDYTKKNFSIIEDRVLQIVNLHQNLKKILVYNNSSLLQSLLYYNCSNTLNTIIFSEIDFNFLNYDIFEQLNVLESIHIIYCSLNNNFFYQIINLSKQFKLKSLFMKEIPQIDSIELLLQRSGHYLRNFGHEFGFGYDDMSLRDQLFELITKYCKNIKYLYLCHDDDVNIYPVINFIENMKHLDYLTIKLLSLASLAIHFNSEFDHLNVKILLQNLGQILPPKLEYLCLNISHVKVNDFEVFLKNSQDTFINKLLIRNYDGQDILPCIKEFVMKKKRVKYLSIQDFFSFDGHIEYLQDKVKEFRSYNIKVQSYNSLVIDIYDYMREID
ncbi:hypothetical protein RhiirC2_781800 [Rhizophagus irregularis]|uniref:F-box domain-containing protein n=1 Tax=Rhizophagus irregularis TaxID=588596 RepID=A0A2N1N4K6_9GLOM|nr:hypothetical protein RhiirC2_781800 [Rhizophagus irregularis]